ncbi:MAG: hypothetical protein IPL53_24230 [Ignavibacteria bacterium]|nr:hypothetical protein [Ignavibacteria bacterium]
MKILITLFNCSLLTNIFLSPSYSNAQNVTVTGALAGNGSYPTLSSAFSAINSASQSGANISILITGNTSEPVTGAILNGGGWAGVLIQPGGGADRTISGEANAGTPLIGLNGADYVKIDGLNSEGNSLTISNTRVSSFNGTSTIRFQSDATNNVITRCKILGSSLHRELTGNIVFGQNSVSTGNDNNLISFCDIGPAGSNLPSNGIAFASTSSTVLNSGDTIRDCNIYDYFNSADMSAGILIQGGCRDISILIISFTKPE